MNFAFTPEQDLLRSTLREVLANAASLSIAQVRALNRRPDDDGGPTHFSAVPTLDDVDLWRQLADLGYLGLPFPSTYGGSEGSFLDLAVVLEEMGRAVGPPAYTQTVVHSGLTIRDHGSAMQQEEWLPRIVAGTARLAAAVGGEVELHDGDGRLRLRGVASHVEEAGRSDALVVVAAGPGAGTSLVLVPRTAEGVTLRPQRTVAGGDRCEVRFDDVRIPPEACLGPPGEAGPAVELLRQRGAVATCLDMVGGAAAVLEMAVAYAMEREQFGRKIGSFQAVQHHAANMAVDVEASQLIAYQAAWKLSEGLDATLEVAMAKAWCGEAYRRVCTLGHQIFGGIGLMREHDMHLFLRRSRRDDLQFGDAPEHLDRIAAILDEVETPWPDLRGFSLSKHPT